MPQFRVSLTRVRPGDDRTIVIEHGVREIEADNEVDAREKAATGPGYDEEGGAGIEWSPLDRQGFRCGDGAAFVNNVQIVGPKGAASRAQTQLERSPMARAPGEPIKMEPGAKPLKPTPEPDPNVFHDPNAPNNGADGAQQSQAARDAKAQQIGGQGQNDQGKPDPEENGQEAGETGQEQGQTGQEQGQQGTDTGKGGKNGKKSS